MRGGKPTPTQTLRLRGSWRAGARQNEPEAPTKAPTVPRWLSSTAKTEWRRATKLLLAAGIITELDRGVLAAYCQAWGDFVECEAIIRKEGRVAQSRTGAPYAHPAVGMMTNARNSMVKYAAELGLTPTARPRIQVTKPEARVVSAKDRYRRKA